jgi:hypothetical protein
MRKVESNITKSFKIGLENEFTTGNFFDDDYEIEKEFYNKQFEDNKNLITVNCKEKLLKSCLKKKIIKLHNNSIKKILQKKIGSMILNTKKKGIVYFSPSVVSIINNSIVFNGIHLTVDKTPLYEHIYDLSDIQLRYLQASIPINSWRKLLSHHIFGKYRNSIYTFKSREKFIPINLKDRYIEFRFVESLDFINPLKLEELITYLKDISKKKHVQKIVSSKKYKNRFHLLRKIPSDFLINENGITTIENKYIIKALKIFKAGYVDFSEPTYNDIQKRILKTLLNKKRIHLKILTLHIRDNNIINVYKKIKNITTLYHEGLYRRYTKSPNSPINKLLLYPSLKLIKKSTKYIPIQEFPSVKIKILENNTNDFLIQFRITLKVLPFIFDKDTLNNFINVNSDLINIYEDFTL